MAIEMAIKVGTYHIIVLFAVALAVVARWRHPVASGVALNVLHWVMLHVLLQRLTMAIEMASDGCVFVRHRRFFCLA